MERFLDILSRTPVDQMQTNLIPMDKMSSQEQKAYIDRSAKLANVTGVIIGAMFGIPATTGEAALAF